MLRRWIALFCVLGLLVAGIAFAQTGFAGPNASNAQRLQKPPEKPDGNPPGGGAGQPAGNGAPGGGQKVTQGAAAVLIDADVSVTDATYASTNMDENAVRVTGAVTALMTGVTVEKSGDTENADACNFYGQNAGLLATDGASVTLANAQVHTDGSGANGVFAYGAGTGVSIADSTVRTERDNSGGILVTGGGMLNASNLTVETQGQSSAAIRSDRGGGTLIADGGTYTANGTGSPAIYSTAEITVSNAKLEATASEAVVVEGKNSVKLENCDVTGNMQGTYGSNSGENIHNVMLYQSMSGDAEQGRSDFAMTGGSLTAANGDMFYVTNTACAIELSGVALTLANGNLLTLAGNDGKRGWGAVGSNGGDCLFTADAQTLSGVITVDAISTLTLSLKNGSYFEGTVNPDGQAGEVNVTLDSGSTWTLTADAYVTTLNGDPSQVTANGYTLHIAE